MRIFASLVAVGNTYGGMREISVDDPAPGEGGLRSVVSMRVQRSPLAPQLPGKMVRWLRTAVIANNLRNVPV